MVKTSRHRGPNRPGPPLEIAAQKAKDAPSWRTRLSCVWRGLLFAAPLEIEVAALVDRVRGVGGVRVALDERAHAEGVVAIAGAGSRVVSRRVPDLEVDLGEAPPAVVAVGEAVPARDGLAGADVAGGVVVMAKVAVEVDAPTCST